MSLLSASGRDKDIGFYVQDTWKPGARVTATLGVRVDLVRRHDAQRGFSRQSSTEVGPRAGFSYLLTDDAKNVLRGTFARVHEQLQDGRHGVSSFGGADAAAIRDTYDLDGNGTFEAVFDSPARTSSVSSLQFDPGMSQPTIDEYILGYRRQFPGQMSVDVAGIARKVHNMFAQTDINGIYPSGPNQPFGGFGLVDPNQGIVYRLTNNTWSAMHYRALQITVAKNLSRNFQAMAAIHRQWQHDSGTWNPTDPARFIQPDGFPNNRMLWRTRDPNDHNSYPGSTTAPMWNPFSYRFNGTWNAPAGIVVGGSYSVVWGGWSSWIVDQLPANSPELAIFGPATVVSSTGSVQSNPLRTRIRFVYPTRGEGQVLLAATHTVGIKLSKRFRLGGTRDIEIASNVLNLLNAGRGTEYARGGANRRYNTVACPQPGNLQAARSFQLDSCSGSESVNSQLPIPNSQTVSLGVGSWALEIDRVFQTEMNVMSDRRYASRTLASSARALMRGSGLVLSISAAACSPAAAPAAEQADPMADGAENVRLVGYSDLQGRQSLQLTTRSDAANGNWAYVGHQPNDRPNSEEPQMNPITGQAEINGTSIIDITDPAKPTIKWHIPGISRANHRHVSVVYDYKHDSSGRDYLVRSSDTGEDFRFQIFDITDRATNPQAIKLVSEITGTPPNSCGPGCGGKFITRAHKGFWSEESGYYYTASGEPGFRNTLLHIWDLRDPTTPKFVGRTWLPGMKDTEDKALYQGQYVHHPTIDEANNRMYIGFRDTSGQMGAWDISDRANPKLVWSLDTKPPNRGPHTLTPIVYDQLPNFHGDALPRTYVFMTDEAAGAADSAPCTSGVRARAYMFDVTDESHPTQVSQWEVPVGDFCKKGGRFGPHQHAEFVNGRLNRHEDRVAWVAYFNAGVRVVDLSDPYSLKELGYYIPKTNAMSHPSGEGQATAIQINDVTIDHRGLAYATDRVGTGLFVLEYTGGARDETR